MKDHIKTVSKNKKAYFDYFILSTYEAGIELFGTEVKSIRQGSINLKDSFCIMQNGELVIKNMHIALYDKSGAFNTKDSRRDRKLLLHTGEILKINAKITQKGLTLIPLKLYFKGALIKMELGICQGKHTYDKKRSIMEKDLKREKERQIKNYR